MYNMSVEIPNPNSNYSMKYTPMGHFSTNGLQIYFPVGLDDPLFPFYP
jgi:hypothetical protein